MTKIGYGLGGEKWKYIILLWETVTNEDGYCNSKSITQTTK